jgi:lysophospholipid acyltransferase (LPLAT)-like uncharacterized protein
MRRFLHRLMLQLGPGVAFFLIKFLQVTMKIEELNGERIRDFWERGENAIGAFWHGRLLMTPLVYGGRGLKILISRHRDGELISRTVRHFGLETVRGSSTRGGIAGIKALARALQEGYDVAIAPDGPRGPRCKVQPGVIQLAKLSGRPIFPFTFSASPRKVLPTWDHFIIPLPCSRGVFVWGEPIWVNQADGEEAMEQKALLLERRLQEITELADRYFTKGDDLPRG